MLRANHDIRRFAVEKDVMLWQLAAQLGMTDSNLSRKLRFELTNDEKAKMKTAVQKIKEGKQVY